MSRYDPATAVRLVTPALRHAEEFLCAVRRSRRLHSGFVSPPRDREGFRKYVVSLRKENRCGFLVISEVAYDFIGVINLSEIVRGSFQSAYLGYYAFLPFAGRGLMCQGLRKVIDHCFGQEKLHRLEANIQPKNDRSISLVSGLGFKCEGYSRRYLKVCGRWKDHERWALLADDWRSAQTRMTSR